MSPKSKVYLFFTLLILIVLTSACTKSSINKKQLDAFMAHIESHDMGFGSLSIFKDGNEVYTYQIGFADLENNKKNDKNTRFRIGSISKTFTAVVIMQMVEEEKLTLETTLNNFFPLIKNSEKITIRQMLQHESGIFSFTSTPDWVEWSLEPISKDELLEMIIGFEPVFEPGERFEYSNTPYMLLAFIAELIDFEDFDTILENRIIKRGNLTNTQPSGALSSHENIAQAYVKAADWIKSPETHDSGLIGTGGIISTPYDLNKFFHGIFYGVYVSDLSLLEMVPDEKPYGLGLMEIPFYEKYSYGHAGSLFGFQATSTYFPIEQVVFTYLSNGVSMIPNDINIGVLSILFGLDYNFPDFSAGFSVPVETLKQYEGVYESPDLPITITIFVDNDQLFGQAEGQSPFPLTAIDQETFTFDTAHIRIVFDVMINQMSFKQGTFETVFNRQHCGNCN